MVLEHSCIQAIGRESLRKRWVLQLIGDFVCFEGRGLTELAPEAFARGLECGRYLLQALLRLPQAEDRDSSLDSIDEHVVPPQSGRLFVNGAHDFSIAADDRVDLVWLNDDAQTLVQTSATSSAFGGLHCLSRRRRPTGRRD